MPEARGRRTLLFLTALGAGRGNKTSSERPEIRPAPRAEKRLSTCLYITWTVVKNTICSRHLSHSLTFRLLLGYREGRKTGAFPGFPERREPMSETTHDSMGAPGESASVAGPTPVPEEAEPSASAQGL